MVIAIGFFILSLQADSCEAWLPTARRSLARNTRVELPSGVPNIFRTRDEKVYPQGSRRMGFNQLSMTKQSIDRDTSTAEDEAWMTDDEALLQHVSREQLQGLCRALQLSEDGTSEELLNRLRSHAKEETDMERERRAKRAERVERGTYDDTSSSEKYEMFSDTDEDSHLLHNFVEDDDDDVYFYVDVPTIPLSNTTQAALERQRLRQEEERSETKDTNPGKPYLTQQDVLTPPPPKDLQPDENGERVVTVYSTKEENDLTGINNSPSTHISVSGNAAADAIMSGSDGGSSSSMSSDQRPWEQQPHRAEATNKEIEEAREIVEELVQHLLALSGAPGFQEEFNEGLQQPITQEDGSVTFIRPPQSASSGMSTPRREFVGFDPSTMVSGTVLEASSQALRSQRGEILNDVLRDVEIRAVGQDGMAGDDKEKGGGHYREVQKVRAFLEGYRRAEVRRIARETATMLLEKLATEGIQGLDFMLASMIKSNDDTGDPGELNDALNEYLSDAVREQEQRVKRIRKTELEEGMAADGSTVPEIDMMANLWKLEEEEGGQPFETFDPMDPDTKKALDEEIARNREEAKKATMRQVDLPVHPAQQVLLMLQVLRDRLRAEASFPNDEYGRNLRTLAYCLQFENDVDRRNLIVKEMGIAVDRLDTFAEMILNSIEYAKSVPHQLQPAKTSKPLNIPLLKRIHELVVEIREEQMTKASGVSPSSNGGGNLAP